VIVKQDDFFVPLYYASKGQFKVIFEWLEKNCKGSIFIGYYNGYYVSQYREEFVPSSYTFVSLSTRSAIVKPSIIHFKLKRDCALFVLHFPDLVRDV